MRKTKIVCTLGPATDKDGILEKLIIAGMDVARFNFSHGTHEEQAQRLKRLRELSEKHERHIGALMDTRGPEIRLGLLKDGKVELKNGQVFKLTTQECLGDENKVYITYKDLPKDVAKGSRILIDDGLIELIVEKVDKEEIACKVINGGMISNRKGVNVPGVNLSMPFISEKDREDILMAAENGFDFIAASFTRTAGDVLQIRRILKDNGGKGIRIIAKIENLQGVENINEILQVADGIMVARGDLGVEIPGEDVPVIQKRLIKKAYNEGKQVITATQMLESMIQNPRPTRAEAADVANAIYDGSSAVMLSGETAAGAYPVEAVETMARIAERTEQDIDYVKRFNQRDFHNKDDITGAISHATCTVAHDLKAKIIIAVTKSGRTAYMVSKCRPNSMIAGCSPSAAICRQMSLAWGVIPVLMKEESDTTSLFSASALRMEELGYLNDGEIAVTSAGLPLGVSGTTNMMKVHVCGELY